jgi:non-canonical poly(A) RNA polymerase PAPD5/7
MHSVRAPCWQHAGSRKAKAAQLDQNLGLLLIDFFRFFGRALKYQGVGVSCADGGCCYDKVSKGFGKQARDRGERFSVMDPLDPSNDVSRCGHRGCGVSRC